MTELDAVVRRHGYHAIRVKDVVRETDDTRSFVLDIPAELRDDFGYRSGQFCTFRIHVDGAEHSRCYSMSSAPETDDDLTVTVKRVPGGIVSNWLNDHVAAGDLLEVTRPAGMFCIRPGERPVVGFCGGSGVTPVISIAKSVLSSTARPVHLLYANRDPGSVIFDRGLDDLLERHPERLAVRRHFDADGGFLDAAAIVAFVEASGVGTDADCYICGPGPFMDIVERALVDLGVPPDHIFIERFVTPDAPGGPATAGTDDATTAAADPTDADADAATPDDEGAGALPENIVLIVRGKKHELPYKAGDTVLGTARRAGLQTPYSCEAGSCATCMALLREGTVAMRTNDVLEDDEVAEGWVLTCQSEPTSPTLTIEFEPM
jgi:ferredoxin-NADP reductase